MKQGARLFFKYARARHQIYLDRQAGVPRNKWTRDPILSTYRFTNVFRELDKVTIWYRQNVREKVRREDLLLATVVFRMFNRIETGEAIFSQKDIVSGMTAFELFVERGDVAILRHAIKTYCGKGPYVTGAYIISSPMCYTKLDGVLEVLRRFYHEKKQVEERHIPMDWRSATNIALGNPDARLQGMFDWLSEFDYFGKFHSYEIVTDLRHTPLLSTAPDINTWCNIGPGAKRGINRVMGRGKGDRVPTAQMLEEMKDLLKLSRDQSNWPREWGRWELREVEHTLCEFDKFERVRLGEGRPRGVYR